MIATAPKMDHLVVLFPFLQISEEIRLLPNLPIDWLWNPFSHAI